MLPLEQFIQQINNSKNILIALPDNAHVDVVAAGVALSMQIKLLNKNAFLVGGGNKSKDFDFLPGASIISNNIADNIFTINLDISVKKLAELSYEQKNDSVSIFLTSKGSPFNRENISFSEPLGNYDSIIILGCQRLEDIGELFVSHSEIFYNTPKINIDNRADNEYFADINIVELATTSISEIMFDLINGFSKTILSEDIATCLLAGIMSSTQSFQDFKTTPKSFIKASRLIELGARQQDLVRYLFKTKPLPVLKLWGKTLVNLSTNDDYGYSYSTINQSDLTVVGATAEDLLSVLKYSLANTTQTRIFVILLELDLNTVRILMNTHPQLSTKYLYNCLNIGNEPEKYLSASNRYIDFTLNKPLSEGLILLKSALEKSLYQV